MQRDRPKHRLYVADLTGSEALLAQREAHHALHVLRLKAGHTLDLFDGKGGRATGTILRVDRNAVTVGIECPASPTRRTEPAVHVLFAPPKGRRLDWMLQKLTELGVHGLRLGNRARATFPCSAR